MAPEQGQLLLCFSLHSGNQDCYAIYRSGNFLAFLHRPEWLVIKPDRYSSVITAVYLLTNFPPGIFRYRQGPTVIIQMAAASSYVTPRGNLTASSQRALVYCMYAFMKPVCCFLCVETLYFQELPLTGRRAVIPPVLQACLDTHIPTHLLGNTTADLLFLLVVLLPS